MKPTISIPSLVLVTIFFGPLASAQDDPASAPLSDTTEHQRDAVSPVVEGLTADVGQALNHILRAEEALMVLTQARDVDGNEIVDEAQYKAMLADKDGPFQTHMRAQMLRFDFHGQPDPPLRLLADSIRFDSGYQAAQALLKQQPEFEIEDLLCLFTQQFIQGPALWQTEQAETLRNQGIQAGQLAPLTNAGSLGYLAWGILRQETYWEDEAHDREAFIANMLLVGFESNMLAALVSRAIAPPMPPPREKLAKERPGRGVAGPNQTSRAKVGFTKAHEELLEADLKLVEEIQKDASLPTEIDLDKHRVSTDGTGQPRISLNPRGHLKVWLPETLAQIRWELYPLGASEKMRHSSSLAERKYYWQLVFQKYGFVTGREMLLEEIRNIMTAEDAHPNAERINELLVLKAAGELTPELQEELWALKRERDGDRDDLLLTCISVMARSGVLSHHELVLQTLLTDMPTIFGDMHPFIQSRLIYSGWEQVVRINQPENLQVVIDHIAGARTDLPPLAVGILINNISAEDYPGAKQALNDILAKGSPMDVASVMMNPGWIEPERLPAIYSAMVSDFEKAPFGTSTKPYVAASFFAALGKTEVGPQTLEVLLGTFESGHWTDPESMTSLGWYMTEDTKQTIKQLISPATLAKFQAEGKLAPGFF